MREEFEKKAKKRAGRTQEHRVTLTKDQRNKLLEIADKPTSSTDQWRAKVLLALDEGEYASEERRPYEQIAKENQISKPTVYRTAKRFVEKGLEATLNANLTGKPFTSLEERKLRSLVSLYNRQSKAWTVNSLAKELRRSPHTIAAAIQRLVERGLISIEQS